MNSNTYQPTYLNRPNHNPNETNFIKNPLLHYQSSNQSPISSKTQQGTAATLLSPSSMNQNYLSVTPKSNQHKFSPFHAENKDYLSKTPQMSTAKSMVFMGTNKQAASNFNPKKSFGGLGKLASMARTVDKNFDDSKEIGMNKPVQENKQQTNKQYGTNYLKPDQTYKKSFINTADKLGNKFGQNNTRGDTYKSFINPSYNSTNNCDSPTRKFDHTEFLNNINKYKSDKNQNRNNHTPQFCNKHSQQQSPLGNTYLHPHSNIISQKKEIPAYNKFGIQKDINGYKTNKNLVQPTESQHHKLFHQYSAPNLKAYRHEPIQILNNQKASETHTASFFSQFQSPSNNNKNHEQTKNNFANNQFNFQSINPETHKFSSPQIPKTSFMKKFNSDKIDNRLQTNKTGLCTPYSTLNSEKFAGNLPQKALNFNKKFKKVEEPSSVSTTQQNTPVKQKYVPKPTFFKNKQSNPPSYTQAKKGSEPVILNAFNKNNQKQKIYSDYDKSSSPSNFHSTFSDKGSDDSFQYMNENFSSEQLKQWSLQDFQLGDKLGKGAFGDVFIARQKNLGFMCVLKKMSKKRIRQQKRQQHVIRQLKIQMFLNHKHLTAMYGYFHDKQYIYLILQYLPDGNLSQIKRKKKTSQKQTATIIKQVCQGLDYMHKLNIIHRDIKPQNIFVNQGYMKLGDFGCSVFTDGLRKTVVSCLEYSSPEQLNNGYYNQKIDVWGVGILAFELLTGKSPYENKIMNMAQGSHEQVDFSDLKFPSDVKISDQAKDFISSLLNIDPIDRLDICEALQHKFITSNKQQNYVLQ